MRTTPLPGLYSATVTVGDDEQAQQLIDQHLLSDAGGRCTACGGQEPCFPRSLARTVLLANGRLPRRTPRATLRQQQTFNGFGSP